ncbi:MAG: TlpA family protein disulfide reductase [Bacteroidetes bacterium]|nr:MAG: TlpA family protein disulfide reductase [Bacteroidota bacterium]
MLRNLLLLLLLFPFRSFTQTISVYEGAYRAVIEREDGKKIIFNLDYSKLNGKPVIYIRNANEKILVDQVQISGDSLWFQMPVFESQFRVKVLADGNWKGFWVRGTTFSSRQEIPFYAYAGITNRFSSKNLPATNNISGRWEVEFKEDETTRPAIAEFTQNQNYLTGTFLTPSGDYRYLEGRVSADSMELSVFDGTHAYYFSALITSDSTISSGLYIAGSTHVESWKATKNPNATLPEEIIAMHLKPGQERLNFRFPDLDGKMVSINDPQFNNKVVVVQIMGSWCPNCMDETAFLSEYYKNHKNSGLEIIALAYEYSTDFERSKASLNKFRKRFNVAYPMLITGVSTSDSLRTEKTLPQFTPIKGFPTTIFIGKDGKVKKTHGGFYGPGTGIHFEESKEFFIETVNELLKEKEN